MCFQESDNYTVNLMYTDENDISDENYNVNESINLSFHFIQYYFHMLTLLQL